MNKVNSKKMRGAYQANTEKDKNKEDSTTLKLEIATSEIVGSSRATDSEIGGSKRDSMGSPYVRTSPFFVPRIGDGTRTSIRSMVENRRSKK